MPDCSASDSGATVHREPHGAIISLAPHVDRKSVLAAERQALAALGAGHRRIVVDAQALQWLGTSAFSALVVALRRLISSGASVTVIGAPAGVRRLLALVELTAVLPHETATPAPPAAQEQACPAA
jgi:anti-anti-sigma regulatory factor